MGWLYGHDTRKSLIDHLVRSNGTHTHKHCLRGNNLWTIEEIDGTKFIVLYLLRGSNSPWGWGYKDMDESVHPFYYNCPLGYLDMVDEPVNDNSREWREKVREYHAAQSAKKEGAVVRYGGTHYKIGARPSTGKGYWAYRLKDHAAFIMQAAQLKRAELCLPSS